MFLGLPDPDPLVRYEVRIRILLSSRKNSKRNLDSYSFVTFFMSYDFLSLKPDVNVASKSNKHRNSVKKICLLPF